MKDGISTVLLLAALGAAFGYSWRTNQPQAESRVQIPSPHVAAVSPRKPTTASSKVQPLPTYGGYPCSSADCTEHKAGFRWAEENVINDPDSCTGNTAEFIEGCRVYARQHDDQPG